MSNIIPFENRNNRSLEKDKLRNNDDEITELQQKDFHLRIGESEIRITQAGNIELRNAHASFVLTADGKITLKSNRTEINAKEEFNCQAELIRLN